MIKYVFIIIASAVLSCATQSQVQAESPLSKYPVVRVRDWDQNTIMFPENYWNQLKEVIVKQIGDEEFEKVKAHSGIRNIPPQMALWDGKAKQDPKILYSKLDRLKLYKIATFTDMGSSHKTIAILKCPYEENKSWDEKAVWNAVYFVISEDALEK